MNALNKAFNAAVVKFMRDCGAKDVTEMLTFTESQERFGGICNTCGYDATVVRFTYRKADGSSANFLYEGSFTDLIRRLTSED